MRLDYLQLFFPDIAANEGRSEQPPQFHPEGDVWIHTRMMLEKLPADSSPTLAWGVLLHDVGKPPTFSPASGPGTRIRFDGHVEMGVRMAENIGRELRFSNDEIEQIEALVANHMRFMDVRQMRQATLKRFVRLRRFDEHLELHRLDCLACHGHLEAYDFVRKFIAETPPEQVRPPKLVTGDDLKRMGIHPGPKYKEILTAVEEAQLDGQLPDRERALDFARNIIKP